ncbi:MAG: hypothetical protein KAU49_02285 [Candidatus Krumholzibacteria bacterium]|nr:hypothetical protein [Candidatus Krumholzibacteria bacterium]
MRKLTVFLLVILTASHGAMAAKPFSTELPSDLPAGGHGWHLASEGLPQEDAAPAGIGTYSPAREGGMSFLLPGLGQYRMGRKNRAYLYFTLEGAGWLMLGTSLWQSNSKENAYREYAAAYAGVDGTGYQQTYYENVGRWISSDGPGGYNEYVRREARDLYYPDQAAMDSYYLDNYVTSEMAWRWTSTDAQHNFNTLRGDSKDAERNALYAAFYLFALRVVSSVDAVYIARRSTNEVDTTSNIPVRFEAGPRPGGFFFAVNRPF